jgi:hypothetical protein
MPGEPARAAPPPRIDSRLGRPGSHPEEIHHEGRSTYTTTGQACFGATWQGTGAWNTDYRLTNPAPGQGVDTTTDKDSSGYGWDPRTVFEKDGKVTITISSDPRQGSRPNCGVQADPPSKVSCSQTGAWQGTLTLRQG